MRRLLLLTMLIPMTLRADEFREVAGRDATEKNDASAAAGDKAGNWTLHFRYKPPRIVTVDIPGKGKQQVWYMPFQVYNRNENPQVIVPVFELVTKDLGTSHKDEPQPAIFKAIAELEDPTGILNLKSTINISKEKIPVTKTDSFPRYVSGLAIWTDVPREASKTNKFSIYVSGLSDGLSTLKEDPNDKEKLTGVKTKALQLDFFKPTDDENPRPGDIKIEDNGGLGGERWIYRRVPIRSNGAAEPAPMKKDEPGK